MALASGIQAKFAAADASTDSAEEESKDTGRKITAEQRKKAEKIAEERRKQEERKRKELA